MQNTRDILKPNILHSQEKKSKNYFKDFVSDEMQQQTESSAIARQRIKQSNEILSFQDARELESGKKTSVDSAIGMGIKSENGINQSSFYSNITTSISYAGG